MDHCQSENNHRISFKNLCDGKRLKSNGLTIKMFQGKLCDIDFQFSTFFLVTFGYKIYVLKKHKMQLLSEKSFWRPHTA